VEVDCTFASKYIVDETQMLKCSEQCLRLYIIVLQDEVRSQNTVFVIVSVAMSKKGRELAWSFFKENWQVFMDRYQVCNLLWVACFPGLNNLLFIITPADGL
jgi:hypothetical protein